MAVPANIIKWVNEQNPRPAVDPDWLRECYAWIASSYSLSSTSDTDFQDFTSHITSQFLQSNLTDSTLQNTGLSADIHTINKARFTGPPCLVEIRAISDIGNSAFSLMNIRQNRMDRVDLAGLAREGDEDAKEDEGPVPQYPRGMLRLELSDGFTTVEAVEYRSIPQLRLGVTPLGYKILLKDVRIRRGIIFLEPNTIELKGHQTEDHELMQDDIFLRSLSRRLGKPNLNPDTQPAGEAEALQRAPPAVRLPPRAADRLPVQTSPSERSNAPSTAVRPKPASTAAPKASSAPGTSKPSSTPAFTSSTFVSSSKPTSSLKPISSSNHSALSMSPYFSTSSTLCSTNPSTSTSSTSNRQDNPSAPLARARILSPMPRCDTLDDDEFEAFVTESGPASPPKSISKLPSMKPITSASEAPRPPSPPSDYDVDSMDLDVDDEMLAQMEKMEADALAAVRQPSASDVKGSGYDMRLGTNALRGSSSARSQASTSALRMTSGSSSEHHLQFAITQHAGSGTSCSRRTAPAPAPSQRLYSPNLRERVIVVDSEDEIYVDDSDRGKENIPLSAQTRLVDDDDVEVEVIDISD